MVLFMCWIFLCAAIGALSAVLINTNRKYKRTSKRSIQWLWTALVDDLTFYERFCVDYERFSLSMSGSLSTISGSRMSMSGFVSTISVSHKYYEIFINESHPVIMDRSCWWFDFLWAVLCRLSAVLGCLWADSCQLSAFLNHPSIKAIQTNLDGPSYL